MSIEQLLKRFEAAANDPRALLDGYLNEGKKAIGCFPYYAPEELVYAAGMIPFGIWGSRSQGGIQSAKRYFAPFYCTLAQTGLELAINGALDGLSGVLMSSMCDTLRPLTQNFRAARPDIPFLFLAHPQNRKLECGIAYTMTEYARVKAGLEEIACRAITDGDIRRGMDICNQNRQARRTFVRLAAKHPERVSARLRSKVLKSSYFMDKAEHTRLLCELNGALAALPEQPWRGGRILVSGILNDFDGVLELFDQYGLCIAADDVAHESRQIRVDADGSAGDPLRALAEQFAAQDNDTLLYDPAINGRPRYVAELARQSGAQGAVILMMQFCDPEEMEYPSLKKALMEAGVPCVMIGVDQQMNDFAQARTALEAFADMLG